MRSTAVKESGSCMLPHLIFKPCECQYSTMSSSLEHRPIITFCGLECRNGLSLKVSFHEKIENETREDVRGILIGCSRGPFCLSTNQTLARFSLDRSR